MERKLKLISFFFVITGAILGVSGVLTPLQYILGLILALLVFPIVLNWEDRPWR